jgi:23S rRNA (cytidine1920-2'-O)/16S rRNA (cytidine1409-2'-O)-methyltransferase
MSQFASRAGEKLEFAIKHFEINLDNKIAGDFGASTGGFTDCLLAHGVAKVYSVDTSYGELAWKLRKDKRVVVMERTNAMHIELPEKVDILTVDTGWTKQEKIIPNALRNIKDDGVIISLIKPHYEAGKARLSEREADQIMEETVKSIENLGCKIVNKIESPIVGKRGGNREWLVEIEKL